MLRDCAIVILFLLQIADAPIVLSSPLRGSFPGSAGLAARTRRIWTREQGLPNNAVECVLQTRDGWLWIGTRSGLARFDGVRFTTFDSRTPGFTEDAILDLAETPGVGLWIATKRGLYWKQGGRFAKLTTTDGLLHDHVSDLQPGGDGSLWVATHGGLNRLQGDNITSYPLTAPVVGHVGNLVTFHQVMSVMEDSSGTLWVGTLGGLQQLDLDHGRFLPVWQDPAPSPRGEPAPTQVVFADREGNLWCGTDEVLAWRRAGVWRSFRFQAEKGDPRLRRICQAPDGTIWIVRGGKLYRMDGEELLREDDRLGLGDSYVTDVFFDPDGLAWIGTRYRGLSCFLPTTLRLLTTRDGLCHDAVTSVCPSRDGGVWVGTVSGLMRWHEGGFVFPDADPAVRTWTCRSVLEEVNGDVWVAAVDTHDATTRVLCREGSRYRVVPTLVTASEPALFLRDRTDRLWIGGRRGLSCFLPGPLPDAEEMRTHPDWTIRYDKRPLAWIFSADLACKVDTMVPLAEFGSHGWRPRLWNSLLTASTNSSSWLPWSSAPADLVADIPMRLGQRLSSYDVRALLEDARGTLWAGTWGGGLNRIADGRTRVFTARDGLADDRVQALHIDAQGALWIGTARGLSRATAVRPPPVAPAFVSFTTRDGLPDNRVNQVLEDEEGNLWIGCDAGIYRVARSDLGAVAAGRATQVQCLLLDEDDGLLAPATHSGSQPSGCRTPDGRLWFATSRGLAVVDPPQLPRRASTPKVFLERVRTGGASIELLDGALRDCGLSPVAPGAARVRATADDSRSSTTTAPVQALRLPAGSGHSLEIEFTALDYAAPSRLRFRYRLEGLDLDWRDAGTRRVAFYGNLRPKVYRFEVQATGRDPAWNPATASLTIAIAPFLLQTRWFQLLVASSLAGVLVAAAVWRFRVLRRVHDLEMVDMLATERDRMARDLHDDLAADLARIALLEASESGSRPAEIARGALDKLSSLIWATDSHFDNLNDLAAYLRQLVHHLVDEQSVSLRLEFPESLPTQRVASHFRRHIALVVKEALTNAIRHGKPSAIAVGLQLSRQEGCGPPAMLELWVQDSGCGFDARHQPGERSRNLGCGGRGLASMRRRVADLGGELSINSAPGRGTTLRIRVRLSLLSNTR